MKKIVIWFSSILLLLVIGFLLGPTPKKPTLTISVPQLNGSLEDIERTILQKETSNPQIKPDNQSRIIWNDTSKQVTEYAIVYLHGFSASPMEADPLHINFAKTYGANLYLPRLAAHGLKGSDAFLALNVDNYLQSAAEAIAVAKKLGKKVIVMACSTGATLGLYLAAEYPEDIHSLMLYSPNIDLHDPTSVMLTLPWGKQITRQVVGSDYRTTNTVGGEEKYWYSKYRIEGLITLKQLVQETMTSETFKKIKQPVFMAYYYKNEKEHDQVVSIPAMENMFASIQTPENMKRKQAFPEAKVHALVSRFTSGCLGEVEKASHSFADQILHLEKVNK